MGTDETFKIEFLLYTDPFERDFNPKVMLNLYTFCIWKHISIPTI